ncbi:MAG: HPr family phosphocarrier protein [Desulfobacteraceae bacterium]
MTSAAEISFKHKVDLFSFEYLKCIRFIVDTDSSCSVLSKKLYSKLITASHLLEDFLDFHGAKHNYEWVFYRELTAAVRHLSLAGYSQKHIVNRLEFYHLKEKGTFELESRDTLMMIQDSLRLAAPGIIREAENLGIDVPKFGYDGRFFPSISTGMMLEHNIDDFDNRERQKKNLTVIASEFLEIIADFDQFSFYERYDSRTIRTFVPDSVNEVAIRRIEMLVHNLQSAFDSYVVHGDFQTGTPKLRALRSHFSIAFHILQVVGRLLHFYERHLHDVSYKSKYKSVSESLSEIIDPDILLDRAVNYGLFYVRHFFSNGKAIAVDILNENIDRSSIVVGIPRERGFHSRPSLLVAKIVQHYGGEVEMVVKGDRFDAASVLDIQWAGGKIKKENIQEVEFHGDVRALADIEVLAAVNYAEDSMGKGVPLPRELSYLR